MADGARGWVVGRAGLWGVPPTWVWVVGVSPQILEHPTSLCDTGVNLHEHMEQVVLIFCMIIVVIFFFTEKDSKKSPQAPQVGSDGKIL